MKTILVDCLNTFVIKAKGVFEEMHDLLEAYPNPKIILTNADEKEIINLDLFNLPYELFTRMHDPEKSNPLYFKELLKEHKLKAKDVIYFEHSPAAVESARKAKILTHYYDAEKKDLAALKEFLDTNL